MKKPKPAASAEAPQPAPQYEPEAYYSVQLACAVKFKGRIYSPAHTLELKGVVLNTLHPQDVARATQAA
jgi:hypothetical protein